MTKTETIDLRVSPKEKEAFRMAAELAGISLSAWMRERLRRAARRDLEEADRQIPFLADVRMG